MFHAAITFVSAAAESVSTFDDADAALASGPPFLAVAEPGFLRSRLRTALLVERLGMHTRLTPFALAATSFFAE